MKQIRTSSPLLRLQRKWRAFGMMAVVFARALLRLERAGGWDAYRHAEDLEIRLRTAIIEIYRDIDEAEESSESQTEDEALALSHLRAIALALLGLVLFLQDLKARLPRKGSGVFAYAGFGAAHGETLNAAAPIYPLCYLDSS